MLTLISISMITINESLIWFNIYHKVLIDLIFKNFDSNYYSKYLSFLFHFFGKIKHYWQCFSKIRKWIYNSMVDDQKCFSLNFVWMLILIMEISWFINCGFSLYFNYFYKVSMYKLVFLYYKLNLFTME